MYRILSNMESDYGFVSGLLDACGEDQSWKFNSTELVPSQGVLVAELELDGEVPSVLVTADEILVVEKGIADKLASICEAGLSFREVSFNGVLSHVAISINDEIDCVDEAHSEIEIVADDAGNRRYKTITSITIDAKRVHSDLFRLKYAPSIMICSRRVHGILLSVKVCDVVFRAVAANG
jgi:hypothetical protein